MPAVHASQPQVRCTGSIDQHEALHKLHVFPKSRVESHTAIPVLLPLALRTSLFTAIKRQACIPFCCQLVESHWLGLRWSGDGEAVDVLLQIELPIVVPG